MPERRAVRRLLGVLALAGGTVAVAGAPAVVAQTSAPAPWTGSTYTAPDDGPIEDETFTIEGHVDHQTSGVFRVGITFGIRDGETFEDVDDSPCLPADLDTANTRPADTTDPGPGADRHYTFRVPDTRWPCNGRFAVRASAEAGFDTYDMVRPLVVTVPPVPVPSMQATVAGDDEAPDPRTGATAADPAAVDVTWEPVDESAHPDFVGYRVQRAGPGDDAFATVGDDVLGPDVRSFTDTVEAPGTHRYRVQSLRGGADGIDGTPIPSLDSETPATEVVVEGPPARSTTSTTDPVGQAAPTTRTRLSLPQVDRGTNNASPKLTLPAPPTTLDTGFDDTLAYGEREGRDELPEPGTEFAGEGQSVIQTEDEGAGLLGPVAGAMVLLGWAGHVAYLNRLAKQF